MPRVPIRSQQSQFGPVNNAGRMRKLPVPVIRQPGPAQPIEQFGEGVEPNVARGMNQLQQNIRKATSVANANPFGNGNLLENVVVTTGANVLNHGLGQAYRGYILGRSSAAITVHEGSQLAALDASQITLNASGPGTIDVWVYC
jgi:hypothetical protein